VAGYKLEKEATTNGIVYIEFRMLVTIQHYITSNYAAAEPYPSPGTETSARISDFSSGPTFSWTKITFSWSEIY